MEHVVAAHRLAWWGRACMLLLVASVAVFAVAAAMLGTSDSSFVIDVLAYRLVPLFAGGVAMARGLAGGRPSRPWVLMGLALFAYFLGDLALSVDAYLYSLPDVIPSVGDIFWLAFYPLAFLCLLFLTRRRLAVVFDHAELDALILGTGAFAAGLALMSALAVGESAPADPGEVAVASLFIIGDLVLLVQVLSVARVFDWRPPGSWWLLLAGLTMFAVGDAVYASGVITVTDAGGIWLHLLKAASFLPIAAAAYLDTDADVQIRREHRSSVWGPAVAVVAAGVVLLWDQHGPLRWLMVTAAFLTLLLAVARLVITVREARSLTEDLRRADVDRLTGLPNLRALESIGMTQIRGAALVVVGLDSFKDVNNTLGPRGGDRLLVQVAERLRLRTRESDALFRLGGDGFALVLSGTHAAEAATTAEHLLRALEAPITIDGLPLHISACAGVAEEGLDTPGIRSLLQYADEALTQAKAQGPGLVQIHAAGTGEQSGKRLLQRAEIHAALDSGGEDFIVHYQPIVSIDGAEVLAVEALVRWRHDGKVLAPGDFLANLIRAGAMPRLTRLMMHKSLAQLRDNGLPYPVTVNVPADLVSDPLVTLVQESLSQTGSAPSQLIVEVTEDALMRDPVASGVVLQTLRSQGVRVLFDDFGTGWSGLSSLRDLTVDGLKIDHGFVSRMAVDSIAESIVRGVVTMADGLGLLVIYEGAEDAAVVTLLETFKQGYIQGYAVARPMPIDDLVRWSSLRAERPQHLPIA